MSPWIEGLLSTYKEGLKEQKSDLTREEWKFLRIIREVAGKGTIFIIILVIMCITNKPNGIRSII